MTTSPKQKVLLVGWDAADWKHITPLLDRGLLPTIEEFVNDGVMGNLATLEPELSPMLWNSIATGNEAAEARHPRLCRTRPPGQRSAAPAPAPPARSRAIWNILTQEGYNTHVVGWFAGHPAEPINGICVSPDARHRPAQQRRRPRTCQPEPDGLGLGRPARLAPPQAEQEDLTAIS